jgi:hypothetical protein
MQIAERLSFNNKVMDFCLRTLNWKQDEDQDTYMGKFTGCVEKAIIAEQLFRAELSRPRPGIPVRTTEE